MSNIISTFYIYKICSPELPPKYVYVGSTKAFINRKHLHKSSCNNENNKCYNNKLYTTIRENGGWDNFRMVIIEECNAINRVQSKINEEKWRIELKANLNMRKCHQTEEEYIEYYKEYFKEYREENKEQINQKAKEYREENKEQINQKQKEYREENPDKRKETTKKYREKNKDKINQKAKEKREENKKKLLNSLLE